MTDTIQTFHITDLRALPQVDGLANVVTVVFWVVVFSRGGKQSVGGGETRLDAPDANSFTPVDQITEQQVIDWVIAKEGGEAFLTMLRGIHEEVLVAEEIREQTSSVNLPFVRSAAEFTEPTNMFIEPVRV